MLRVGDVDQEDENVLNAVDLLLAGGTEKTGWDGVDTRCSGVFKGFRHLGRGFHATAHRAREM